MPLEHHYWRRQAAIDAALLRKFADFIGPGKLVVDVGPGYDPWPHASEFIDYDEWPQLAGKMVRRVDVESDRLPYADKAVDFLYCRHTIEDLHNPTSLLREINRVAKAGYIETPSPLAEYARGVDALKVHGFNPDGGHRGYAHHHWICWSDGALRALPKLPLIEYVQFRTIDDAMIQQRLARFPVLWNTYHAWRGELAFQTLRHPVDFKMHDYAQRIGAAIDVAAKNAQEFVADFGLEGSAFYPAPVDPEQSSR